ncbi:MULTISPECIES: ModD protein [unclassified Hyphomicrobium]|uniref:ModD protein n=1 Tax=unclassified Hyphomicrobium TaxID=2619925 RepID=UPI000213D89C|nr:MULTISPECIES: ModD protein [unclassified Hyphomicrobium]CCB66906.1 putative pyrophosphorylase modD [Hyphomicrobium sp. MC1]
MSSTALPHELESLLADDVPFGDLTTEALGIGEKEGEMFFAARGRMVLAEVESAAALLEFAGCCVSRTTRSGTLLEPGSPILSARGTASALHRGWKVAQTLIEVWSGVATEARAIVDAATAVSPRIVVACTRKNMPRTKSFAVRSVRAGGAVIHRLGLSETVLVFPEHRIFLEGEPLAETVRRLRRAAPEKRLVIEAKSVDEAKAYAEAGFDVIQTEKFSTDQLSELVAQLVPMKSRPVIAAAGGITANNAAAYAQTGADVLVTSSPYLASPRDVAVRFALATASIKHTKNA